MGQAKFITHKGHLICYLDFSNCGNDEFLMLLTQGKKLIAGQPEHSVLTLTNVEKITYNQDTVKALKEFLVHNRPFVRKGAVVGLDNLKGVIYNAVMSFTKRNVKVFNAIDEAKDWLAQDE